MSKTLWSCRTIIESSNSAQVCDTCGETSSGLVSAREFDDGLIIFGCHKHSRQKEWKEHKAEQARLQREMEERAVEEKRYALRKVQESAFVSYSHEDGVLIIEVDDND